MCNMCMTVYSTLYAVNSTLYMIYIDSALYTVYGIATVCIICNTCSMHSM